MGDDRGDVLSGRWPWTGAWVWTPAGRVSSQVPLPWGANCRVGREAAHRCSPPLRGYSQTGRQAHRCLTTAHGSRALWAIRVRPYRAHLSFGTCYLGGRALYSLFSFSVMAPHRGWVILLMGKRKKKYVFSHMWVHCGMSTNSHYTEQHRHSCERFMFLLRFLGARTPGFLCLCIPKA